jgi:hypothetical protein
VLKQDLHFYRSNGHLISKNFLTNSNILSLKNLFKNTLEKYLNYSCSKLSFEDNKIHQKLIKFRKESPNKFGEMYDTLNLSATL